MAAITGHLRLSEPLALEAGGTLPVEMSYELHGELRGGNAVLLLHPLGRSHRCAGEGAGAGPLDGWWDALVGPGKALDTDVLAVIAPCLLGAPFGSTSPLSSEPATCRPYGGDFPPLTLRDQARALASFVRALGVARLRAAVGPGLGGVAALALAAEEPSLVGSVASICASPRLSTSARQRLAMVRPLLAAEPSWEGGRYAPGAGPRNVVKRLHREHLEDAYDPDFLARLEPDAAARAARLDAEAEAFASAFDPACYAALSGVAASAELDLARIRARVLLLPSSSDAVSPPARVRDAYHALVAAGVDARWQELSSAAGHQAYLHDAAALGGPLREFLDGDRP